MKLKKVGMRTVKTIIAVVLTLEISKNLNMNSPILAGIAAIMTVEASVSESFTTGKYRMYGTVLGALIALIITFFAPTNFITTAIGLFIIIYISNLLEWKSAVRMAMIVFLVIIVSYEDGGRFLYAFNRTIDTFLGVIIGTAINYFIRPPKVDIKIENIIGNMIKNVRKYIYILVWDNKKPELDDLKKDIIYIEENYEILKKDVEFKVNIDKSLRDYESIFNIFQNIQSHFRVIKLLEKRLYIDQDNKELLERMFLKEIPKIKKTEKQEIDIIYNYHLKSILCSLNAIDGMYEDITYIKGRKGII